MIDYSLSKTTKVVTIFGKFTVKEFRETFDNGRFEDYRFQQVSKKLNSKPDIQMPELPFNTGIR